MADSCIPSGLSWIGTLIGTVVVSSVNIFIYLRNRRKSKEEKEIAEAKAQSLNEAIEKEHHDTIEHTKTPKKNIHHYHHHHSHHHNHK